MQNLTLLLFVLCLSTAAPSQTLLVVNQGSSDVSLVDPATGRQTALVPERTPNVHGHEIAASADGRTAFLPIYGSTGVGKPGIDGHELLAIDIPTHRITGHLDFGHPVRPHDPILDPISGNLFVTTELDKSITIIDPKTLKITGSIPTGAEQSHMLALSHDGRRGYTANVGPGSVSVLDIPNRKTIAIIPVSREIQRISISADDKLVFTADQAQPRLAVIDTVTNKIKSWISVPGLAFGTAATADGRWLLVAIPAINQVAVVDLHTLQVVRHLDVPATPQEFLIAPSGKTAYVSCNVAGQVAVIDLTAWKVEKLITAGKTSDGLAWAK